MKKVLFARTALLIGGMMLTGCKKNPQPTPDPTTKTKTIVYQVTNKDNESILSDCFKLKVTYLDANGQSVTEENITPPWTKSVEVKLPFHAKMEGTYSYNVEDLPDQVYYGRYYGIGCYDGNSLVIDLTGGISPSTKENVLTLVEQHPDRLSFTTEKDF